MNVNHNCFTSDRFVPFQITSCKISKILATQNNCWYFWLTMLLLWCVQSASTYSCFGTAPSDYFITRSLDPKTLFIQYSMFHILFIKLWCFIISALCYISAPSSVDFLLILRSGFLHTYALLGCESYIIMIETGFNADCICIYGTFVH